MLSVCLPGRLRPLTDGAVDAGVAMPETGVEAPEEAMLGTDCALTPLALPTAAGFRDHMDGAAACGRLRGAPRAGKSSSDCVSRGTFFEASGAGVLAGESVAFCLPAAFSESGAEGVAVLEGSALEAGIEADGGGWMMSSSSTTSSTVALCASSAPCFSMSLCAGVRLSDADAVPLIVASVDMMGRRYEGGLCGKAGDYRRTGEIVQG